MSYLDDVARKREEASQKQQREAESRQSINAARENSDKVAGEVSRQGEQARSTTQKVEVTNDLAKKGDIDAVIAQLKEVQLASLLGGQNKPSVVLADSTDLGEQISTLGDDLKNILNAIKSDNDDELIKTLTNQYRQIVDSSKASLSSQSSEFAKAIDTVNSTIQSKDFSPKINVPKSERPEVNIDLSPIQASLDSLEKTVKANKVVLPKNDYSALEDAVRRVEGAINHQVFPVPNYVLPYKDVSGKATQVVLTADGKIPVNATTTVDTTGLATDTNQTNGSQKTQIVDVGGEAVTVTGGKLDVNASVDTTGLATSAKQDSLLTELQLKADLTETQPVSLVSVPSHPVTNAGTFAVQATGTKTHNNAAPTTDNVGVLPALANASSPTYTEGDQTLLSVDTAGNARVTVNKLGGNAISTGNGASGTGVQRVTIASDSTGQVALASGSNTVGSIASVTTSITPGTAAANLGKAEDAAHTTGDVGVMALAVRNDNGAVSAGADGDYLPLTTDATGALRIDLNGTVSTNNSTASVLAGGAVFTGTSEDVLNYNEIRISVISSHVSATDGLSIQQSSDNTNWDITDVYTIPAATGKTYSVPRQARYFRIVYTNGATLQTSFRLQTVLNREGSRVSSQRAGDAYTNETDLEQQQSFLMGYNGSTWDRLRSDTTNGLDVDVTRLPTLANVTTVGTVTTLTGTTTLTPGTGATNLGKAEDAGHTTGDVGVFALGVRNDTLADVTSNTADYSQVSTDIKGRVITAGSPRSLKGTAQVSVSNTTSETTIIAATASTFHDVYGLILANTGASTTKISIRDDTAGTVRAIIEVPTLETRGFMLPVDSAMPQTAVNKNWTVQCGTATTALEVTAFYVSMV